MKHIKNMFVLGIIFCVSTPLQATPCPFSNFTGAGVFDLTQNLAPAISLSTFFDEEGYLKRVKIAATNQAVFVAGILSTGAESASISQLVGTWDLNTNSANGVEITKAPISTTIVVSGLRNVETDFNYCGPDGNTVTFSFIDLFNLSDASLIGSDADLLITSVSKLTGASVESDSNVAFLNSTIIQDSSISAESVVLGYLNGTSVIGLFGATISSTNDSVQLNGRIIANGESVIESAKDVKLAYFWGNVPLLNINAENNVDIQTVDDSSLGTVQAGGNINIVNTKNETKLSIASVVANGGDITITSSLDSSSFTVTLGDKQVADSIKANNIYAQGLSEGSKVTVDLQGIAVYSDGYGSSPATFYQGQFATFKNVNSVNEVVLDSCGLPE